MNIFKFTTVVIVFLNLINSNAHAGPYSDELGRCLIDSTTQGDRNVLIVWMFSAAAQHPVVENLLDVSPEQLDKANKNFANLTVKLLTENCRAISKKAIKFEGAAALKNSFKLLGQVAGRELFTSSHVAGALAGFESHLDSSKLDELNE